MLVLPSRSWNKLSKFSEPVEKNGQLDKLTVTAEKNTLHRSKRLKRVACPSAKSGMMDAASTTGIKGCMWWK